MSQHCGILISQFSVMSLNCSIDRKFGTFFDYTGYFFVDGMEWLNHFSDFSGSIESSHTYLLTRLNLSNIQAISIHCNRVFIISLFPRLNLIWRKSYTSLLVWYSSRYVISFDGYGWLWITRYLAMLISSHLPPRGEKVFHPEATNLPDLLANLPGLSTSTWIL